MSPDERRALEAQIDRHLRRGELMSAWNGLQRLAAQFPNEPALAARARSLEASMDPAERQRAAMTRVDTSGGVKSPVQQAEVLAANGRYAEAITIYRTLLAEQPHSQLVQERLLEIYQLAQVAKPQRLTRGELLEQLLDRVTSRRRS